MTYTQTVGFAAALGIDTTNPVTKGFEFDNVDVSQSGEIIDSNGIRGSRDRFNFRTRSGKESFAGPMNLKPSAEDLNLLIPWITGGVFSDGTSVVTNALSARYVTIDKVAEVFTYANTYVNKATFKVSEGTEMSLALDVVAMSETVTEGGSFPSVIYQDAPPFMWKDAVLTMLGSSRDIKSFTLTIDNALQTIWNNSATPTSVFPTDRHVTFQCDVPWIDANTDLYNQDPDGASATLVLTFGSKVLTFNMAALQVPTKGANIPGREALYLPIDGVVRGANATDLVPSLSVSLALS